MKRLFLGALVALVSVACFPSGQTSEPVIAPAPVVGRPAPDFAVTGVDRVNKLSDLRGKVVIVNFWASWCPYCVKEMPALERVYQKYRDQGLVVLGVDVKESPEVVETFRRKYALTFPTTIDKDGEIFKKYLGTAIPISVFIDRRGFIVHISFGEMKQEQIEEILQQKLGLKSS